MYVNYISVKLEKIPNNQNIALKSFEAKKKLNSSTKTYLFNSIMLSKRHAAGYQRNTSHIKLKSQPLGSPRAWLRPRPQHLQLTAQPIWVSVSSHITESALSQRPTTHEHQPLRDCFTVTPGFLLNQWDTVCHTPAVALLLSFLTDRLRLFPPPRCCENICSTVLLPHLLLTLVALGFHLPPPPIFMYSCLYPSPLTSMLYVTTPSETYFLFSAVSGNEHELPSSIHSKIHFFFTF